LLALAGSEAAQAQQPVPDNPTCPTEPNWSANGQMIFAVRQRPGDGPVLLAEGRIDGAMLPRLEQALKGFRGREIWIRSSGGDTEVGHQAASLIRQYGMATRIPAGWACASACAFMFLGGIIRSIDDGGLIGFNTMSGSA
jgi:hypothetical protein